MGTLVKFPGLGSTTIDQPRFPYLIVHHRVKSGEKTMWLQYLMHRRTKRILVQIAPSSTPGFVVASLRIPPFTKAAYPDREMAARQMWNFALETLAGEPE